MRSLDTKVLQLLQRRPRLGQRPSEPVGVEQEGLYAWAKALRQRAAELVVPGDPCGWHRGEGRAPSIGGGEGEGRGGEGGAGEGGAKTWGGRGEAGARQGRGREGQERGGPAEGPPLL
jgi:hypothetical protein